MELYTILTPVTDPRTSCGYHRIYLPFKELGMKINTQPKENGILYFNRLHDQHHGSRFILDLDDYWILPDSNPHKYTWDKQQVPKRIEANIKSALAVTVTNQQLADKVLPLNKNVHIVPNSLPFDKGQFTKTEPDFSRLVFAGGKSHAVDIRMLTGLPVLYYGGLNWGPVLPIERYMQAYDNKGVSLVPLEPGEFNSCKSNLKVLEAGAKGLACMCSDTLPYANDKDRPHIFLTDDFHRDVTYTTEKELAAKAKTLASHVRKHYHMDDVNKLRVEVLKHYCEKFG